MGYGGGGDLELAFGAWTQDGLDEATWTRIHPYILSQLRFSLHLSCDQPHLSSRVLASLLALLRIHSSTGPHGPSSHCFTQPSQSTPTLS